MKNIPDRIFLDISEEDIEEFDDFDKLEAVDENSITWCRDKINDTDVEYVRKVSPWVSVKERLPEDNLVDPIAWNVTYKVLVLTSNGKVAISQRYWIDHANKWEWKGSGTFKDSIIMWMPIPSFDEIIEANKDVLKRIKEKGD